MGAEEQIVEALLPAVRDAGLEIWDVERAGASLRVLVERPGGIDLDSISQLSAAVSAILDQRDDLVPAGRYLLEVSSPGLERRLRYPAHFARYVGEEVSVKTIEPFDGTRRLRGTLTAATDEGITISAGATTNEAAELSIPLQSIERANAVFSWGQLPKGGQPKKGPQSKKEPKRKPQSRKGPQPTRSVKRSAQGDDAGPAVADMPAAGAAGGVG